MAVDVALPVQIVLAIAIDIQGRGKSRNPAVNNNVPNHSHSLVIRIIVHLVGNGLALKYCLCKKSKHCEEVLIGIYSLESNARRISDFNLVDVDAVVEGLHEY